MVETLRRRDWPVAPTPPGDAAQLLIQAHYTGSVSVRLTASHGLYQRLDPTGILLGPLYGAALWSLPTRDADAAVDLRLIGCSGCTDWCWRTVDPVRATAESEA